MGDWSIDEIVHDPDPGHTCPKSLVDLGVMESSYTGIEHD